MVKIAGKIFWILNSIVVFIKCGNFYTDSKLSSSIKFDKYFPKLKIGKNNKIGSCNFSFRGGGNISVGDFCDLDDGVLIRTYGGLISIGSNVSLNAYTFLHEGGGIYIGNNVRIASHVSIISANHIFNDINIPIKDQGETKIGITIEDDVWIGTGVKILDGVRIKRGTVVGAGAVVNRSLDEYSVYAGVPAKIIKKRSL